MTKTPEQRYVELLTGGSNSPLLTDGYKFSMAQAGAPLRPETFYLAFRHGDPLLVPFDFAEVTRLLRPRLANMSERNFLGTHGYTMSHSMEAALQGALVVEAVPKGTWVAPLEPVLHGSAPSFLASWLEALTIAFNFPMQIATALHNGEREFDASCCDEAAIIELVADTLGITGVTTTPRPIEYAEAVKQRGLGVIEALKGEASRAFECGTRAMTCLQMHRLALQTLKGLGINRTANVLLAYELYMVPVGTTGHEHQQRWLKDETGFRAIRDMRPEPPSYLFDTYDAIKLGIPAAITVMLEALSRRCSVRFDSGDQVAQFLAFMQARGEHGTKPFFIFMDGYTAERTAEMERLCDEHGEADRIYGFGGYFVCAADWMKYTRNAVAAVYKLTQTGPFPVMKFAGSKSSVPGKPVILRSASGASLIAQLGETVEGYGPVEPGVIPTSTATSPATDSLIAVCEARRSTR